MILEYMLKIKLDIMMDDLINLKNFVLIFPSS